MFVHHADSCSCCSDFFRRLDRRRFLQVGGGALAAAALPLGAFAAEGNYDAMVISCIDPRFPELVRNYTTQRGLTDKFSQLVIAGAAIGAVAPAFKTWQPAVWDNIGTSIQLHHIPKVIVINHRDCGAAKIAYGEAKVATRDLETATHKASFTEFRAEAKKRHPNLGVETGLIDLDGKVEMFS